MKKAFAALVIFSMLLTAVAVAEAADVAGVWYLNEITEDGESFNPGDFGISITLTLNEDGTAVMDGMSDEAEEGAWAADGDAVTLTFDGDDMAVAIEDGNLIIAEDSASMVFGREQTAEVFVPAEPVEAALEDYAGAWTADKIGMDGSYYDAALLGADVTATIEDTTITLDGFRFSGESISLEYADGALSFSGTDDESGAFAGITARLLEDGNLSLTLDAGETGAFAFIMAPAEAAEEAPAA
ncbi:MAG: hypothetical protein IJ769_03625 [Clostridia bacterium]|nr:hypothetical protein [Clostridia bacterium]